MDQYVAAVLDWLGCAVGGSRTRAARAAASTGDRALALGAAGHVLDFDDTYTPGLSHLSAPTAPAALVVAAEIGATIGEMLGAYAEGFEAMGALARASHPALYERGWHPTAVCGVAGAAVAAARLLGAQREDALAIALLTAGGLRGVFGSDGKALQVGMAASSGVLAARLAAGGARVPLDQAASGFEAAYGGRYAEPDGERAIERNWIKAWPCCLQTHSAIEAADRVRSDGVAPHSLTEVRVHPRSLQAAAIGPRPIDGLGAKFSIPYLVAYTLLHGPPTLASFEVEVDADASLWAYRRVTVETDAALAESEAILRADGHDYRVTAALGSPQYPMTPDQLAAKRHDLAGTRFDGALDDRDRPARELLQLLDGA
jgi:2-methylcitrate dehydratase PrpD